MATVQCPRCMVERKGFRRELDSWRHKLIHCVGFESILEGIYGPMLLRDLSVFDDCEPEAVDDWSPEASCSQCSFCNLPLDKLGDQVPAATSPLSSPSDYSPCQASISESSQSAHRFLQAVFQKKVPLGCDSNIPLVAQELMKKMIHRFAMDYASKCQLHATTNSVTTRTSSPLSETSDAPLDLTVSRTQEDKEHVPESDGVLDLSNRNSAGSATSSSSSSSSSSSNHKASGTELPPFTEELGDPGQRGNNSRQPSVLDTILSSLCPAHSSLLYQILKLVHQEKLLSSLFHKPPGQSDSYCCSVHPQDNAIPHAVALSECKALNSSSYYPLMACDNQGHGSTLYHPEDSKSSCCIHLCPSKDCNCEGSRGSGYCCVQRVKAFGCINKVMCSFASSPSLCTPPPALCPPSLICCTQHTPYICPCYSNHARLIQVNDPIDRGVVEGDPPCPVLKREQSPSPPPLSPVPSDISKKFDEKPPSLLHHKQEEETDLMIKNGLASHLETHMNTVTEEKSQCRTRRCQAEQNPIGTSLQDVVNRFSEKLETIKPLEKDPPPVSTAVSVSEKEQVPFPSTSENFHFGADAHLTEIMTKLLHTGNSSDYNLDELVDRHDSKEPKSPNTRARRRQEALAALETPPEDSSARRYTLKIKREFAMLDQSCSRRKVSPAKRAKLIDGNVTVTTLCTSSDLNIVKEESKGEMEADVNSVESHVAGQEPLSMFSAESDRDEVKDEIQTVIVTEDYEILKTEEKEREISHEEKEHPLLSADISVPEQGKCGKYNSNSPNSQTQIMTMAATSRQRGRPCKKDNRSEKGKDGHRPLRDTQKYLSNHSKEERRSRRNIVPPQRYSSYVTEPRKMFFVACFSDGIFNQRAQNKDSAFSPLDPEGKDIQLESRSMSLHEFSQKLPSEDSEREQCGPSCTDSKTGASSTSGQLSASPKRPVSNAASGMSKNSNRNFIRSADCVEKPVNPQVEYISPIKRMFVSPVKDKEGVRYSLKSAGSGSNSQADEHFDPCEVSSWSGTPEKHKSQSTQSPPSKLESISSLKSATSPAKSVWSPTKSGCSPCKSASSPAKSASSTPKSASSPAKSASSTPKSVSSPAKSASSTPKYASSPSKAATSVLKSASSPGKSTSPLSKSASSPKSASSSPKIGSRRSVEGAPIKRVAGTESQRSPFDLSFHEATPPKRRPGRPKKLGPQLEQKVKRPIGRPRKQKADDSVIGAKTVSGKSVSASDTEETVNKNLKITVVYGRSRRNKRMVSEGFDQLQTEFHDACQAVGLKSDLGILMHSSKTSSGGVETASTQLSEEFTFVTPVKDSAPQSCSNIKCQKREDSVPSRKPGRPAKVKISGISVTVTTVSPRQRKIQINKETQQSPETLTHRQVLLPELKSAKEPWTISHLSTNKSSQTEKGTETKDESKDNLPKQTAVRHSMRVRKPSIHFLHAVATSSSRSYSHSNALLRRSKQLLLNKANNERRKEEQKGSVEASREKRQPLGHDKRKNISQDMRRVAGVSVDSIFTQKETLRWWAASAEEKTMNQELARRIRLISDTWVSDSVESQEKEIAFNSKLSTKGNYSFIRKSKHSSVVRSLFDCPPNKPRSCSMQQLCCWFMQTTETQSLAIVKKASSRNPYELRHFPRSTNKKSVCHSPQAERLRKHIKKFAKTVPKSPLQHRRAQERLRKRSKDPLPAQSFRRQLFATSFATGRLHQGVQWWRNSTFRKYQATLLRARTRFLTQKEREEEGRRRLRNKKNTKIATSSTKGHATGIEPYCTALSRSSKDQLSDCLENSCATSSVDQTQEPVDVTKEQNLCSKAWSPETLKECRVFLRKINSPDNESTEEEWDSCTVTLDDGSPSAYLFAGKERELVGVVKAVKTERTRSMNRTTSRELAGSAPKSVQEQDKMPAGRQKHKYKSPGVSAEAPQPPPAKILRQSRMRGLTGPRWCDFVFEN
ncbi:uncharacterized protein lcorl isoform X2 [Echeneis naucrates]|uniref:uncharacterized protein lcorl isoform X2 n=1 Tax=Echeneis naucrates TaxID=173247 RepID=UPI0011133F0D|nr:ligand-dependent nuclear receptor corepressor-like protein isoform X2 [Echeneis naucrates]